MDIIGPAKLLTIYIGESDKWHGKPLATALVERLRAEGAAGATVTRAIEGFGANSRIHSAHILRLSEDLPIIIEIVDDEENIKKLLPYLDESVTNGIVTMEKVKVIKYRS